MYHVVGLLSSGQLSMLSSYRYCPGMDTLQRDLAGMGYTQVLVITDNRQVGRFEYKDCPQLKNVRMA